MSGIVFCDCETTGLDPFRHELWEIAVIDGETLRETLLYRNALSLPTADATALRINGFYERGRDLRGVNIGALASMHGFAQPIDDTTDDAKIAGMIANLTAGKHLVGAVPSFDALFLEVFLRGNGFAPAWHYQTIDVEALAAGKLGLEPPWDTEEISRRLEIPPSPKHTAMGDARWARDVYRAVLG